MKSDPQQFDATRHLPPLTIHSSARRAVIDVGTNSVKLLVADVSAGAVEPVWEGSEQTRLGRGFYTGHRLQPEAISATARAVAEFARLAGQHEAGAIRVIATSAARDAVNREELVSAIRAASGFVANILTGAAEAELAFRGVLTDPTLGAGPLLILDVGGGSTEFILGNHGRMEFRQSYALGSVRLRETLEPADPPAADDLPRCRRAVRQFLEQQVRPELALGFEQLKAAPCRLVGTGGAATILARMAEGLGEFDRARIEAAQLTGDRVRGLVGQMWALPLADRRELVGMPRDRADIILFGAAIYEAVMEAFGFGDLRVSTRGLRFGAVLGFGE